ncbi:MAG: nitroreductase family protein [Verrucomicrobia bacterium]|nr:nitroreductase family protein [Verrucomicrobiota bacterium]
MDPALVARLQAFKETLCPIAKAYDASGGLRIIRKQEIAASLPPDAYQFFALRSSVRQFAEGKIPEEIIREAVRIAQRAPSACNRQSCRLHYSTDPDVIAKTVLFQDGAGGFGERAAAVFIVTSELGAFNHAGERNQGYVDGGIFSMTFALGLHALGYGTCFLNWCATAREDQEFRRAFKIPPSELIVALLVGGCLRDEFAVARSPRLPVDEVMCRL